MRRTVMLTFYIVCAVVGLGMALISAFVGDHGQGDGCLEIGHDAGTDLVHDFGHEIGQTLGHDGAGDLWLPFFSLRFWTYGFGSFGLGGILFTLIAGLSPNGALLYAIGTGLVCGLMVSLIMRFAQKAEADSSAKTKDMLGLTAEVLVGIRPGQMGKVRFAAKGDTIDMLAVADDNTVLEAGQSAIVVAIEGDKARVVSRDVLFEEDQVSVRR